MDFNPIEMLWNDIDNVIKEEINKFESTLWRYKSWIDFNISWVLCEIGWFNIVKVWSSYYI